MVSLSFAQAAHRAADTDRFSILFVCTGNICRSPFAERLTRARLGEVGSDFVVASAGTHALVGEPMHPYSAEVLRRLGGNAGGFAARLLTRELVATADLVLTANRRHRAATAELYPRVAGHSFTICEFSMLAAAAESMAVARCDHPVERARALVSAAAGMRGHIPQSASSGYDIQDPFGADLVVHDRVSRQMAQALAGPLELIIGPTKV